MRRKWLVLLAQSLSVVLLTASVGAFIFGVVNGLLDLAALGAAVSLAIILTFCFTREPTDEPPRLRTGAWPRPDSDAPPIRHIDEARGRRGQEPRG